MGTKGGGGEREGGGKREGGEKGGGVVEYWFVFGNGEREKEGEEKKKKIETAKNCANAKHHRNPSRSPSLAPP